MPDVRRMEGDKGEGTKSYKLAVTKEVAEM